MAPKATATRQQTADAPQTAPAGNLPATAGGEKRRPLIVEFRDYVQARMATLEDALPPTITPKRFVSVLMTALQTKPDLLKCTFQSLWNACVRAAQDGLLPDGREGAIAPYGESENGKRVAEIATWMPMIAGWRKKVYEAGGVKTWRVECVFEKDEFDYDLADQKIFFHKRPLGNVDPGGVVGAYSVAKLANDETVLEVMSAFQINQVRSKSKAANGPWSVKEFFPEMCKKVVARRHYKQLPHSESMDAMIAREDQENGFADPEATPIARPERRQLSSRAVMDQYAGATDDAGQVIDHDAGTGEVIEQDRGDFQDDSQTQTAKTEVRGSTAKDAAASKVIDQQGNVVKDRDSTAAVKENANPAGGTSGGASTEAGASGDATTGSASASNAQAQSNGEVSGDLDLPEDDLVDGADRPWPPGEIPTDAKEYERYLATKLASMTKASEVAPWFNSLDEKALRVTCQCTPLFKELQDLAIARRKELP